MLALLIAETIASPACVPDDPCRAVLRSVTYWTDASVVFVAYALIVLPFLFARTAVWCALLLALAVLAGAGITSYPWGWAGAALVWAILGGLDVAGRRRQAHLSAGWGPIERPVLPTRPLRWDEDTRRLGSLIALALLVVAAALAAVHIAQLRDVERYEAVATRTIGTVIDPGIDGPLVLEVNGQTHEIELTIESYRRGDELPVLLDPSTSRISLVAEPDDPSWLIGWATVAVVLAGCTWTTLWSRGKRRADLLRNGGPSSSLLLLEDQVTALGDTTMDSFRPRLVTGDLVLVDAAFVDGDRAQSRPRRAVDRPISDAADHDEQPVPLDQLSDADLRAWADDLDDEDDSVGDGAVLPRPVTVIGHLVDGYPILVRDGDQLLLGSRAVRDPWTLCRLPPRPSATREMVGPPTVLDGHYRRWARWQSHLALLLALLLAVPAGLLLWWLFDDPAIPFTWIDGITVVGMALALAAGLHRLAQYGQPVLRAHPAGLLLTGPFLATVLPGGRVIGIVTARHSIVLRLDDPSDFIDIDIDTIAGHPATADEATVDIHRWLRNATKPHTSWQHRPSLSLVPPALLLITVAAASAAL